MGVINYLPWPRSIRRIPLKLVYLGFLAGFLVGGLTLIIRYNAARSLRNWIVQQSCLSYAPREGQLAYGEARSGEEVPDAEGGYSRIPSWANEGVAAFSLNPACWAQYCRIGNAHWFVPDESDLPPPSVVFLGERVTIEGDRRLAHLGVKSSQHGSLRLQWSVFHITGVFEDFNPVVSSGYVDVYYAGESGGPVKVLAGTRDLSRSSAFNFSIYVGGQKSIFTADLLRLENSNENVCLLKIKCDAENRVTLHGQ